MRSGQLKYRAQVVGGGLFWAGLVEKLAGSDSSIRGLRIASAVEVRAREHATLSPGTHLRIGQRLFVVMAVRPIRRGEIGASVVELVGAVAIYQPASGVPVTTRCYVAHDAVYLSDTGKSEYRAKLEVPLIECPRPQPGDRLTVSGITYKVIGLVEGEDDGVVRAVWGKPQ